MAGSLLEMLDIEKSFFGVQVLKQVTFGLQPGEVHVLLGHNGAGKSTLIKILSGAYAAEGGTIRVSGTEIDLEHHNPKRAEESGIATVYQNFHLIPDFTVAENLSLHRFTREKRAVRWKEIREHAKAVLQEYRFNIDPEQKAKTLTVSGKQMLEIAIALSKQARILIMDEPTAALSNRETELLFEIIRRLKDRGMGIIYISHKLEEIKEIGDKVTVLRDGANVSTMDPRQTSTEELIALMVGRTVHQERTFREIGGETPLVTIRDVQNENLREPISFSVRNGEILGITGLVGAGKTELARAIFGADRVETGSIEINDRTREVRSPVRGVNAGIGYLPEDRDSHGLFLNLSVRRNISLARTTKARGRLFTSNKLERTLAENVVRSVNVRTRSIDQKVKYLSGGNKQKVILGRWLKADCTLLLLDEPTIGIDVGAREEIYQLVREFVAEGDRSVLFISSDMDEVLAVCDRILVMSSRKMVAELDPKETNKQQLMQYSIIEKKELTERVE